ncbi:PHP domain-containing protein [Halalkalicoccus ordinarius]|uniref:PHP domain-containing protein n=1 Tax=Halalkalicoccus ordinarius TaxID=3116651 RepID=UPI00300E9644
MLVTHDYHTHSTYSDGTGLPWMVAAAEEAGLDAIGFADHCNVSERESAVREKYEKGFNLDLTYERRREAIEGLRERTDLTIYDAVELDYDPRDEEEIRTFLAETGFDYALGSVHDLDGTDVQDPAQFDAMADEDCRAVVDAYYEALVELVESELFAVAAHVDLVERTPPLRGYAGEEHFEAVADAFERSRTVPEINAGRILRKYGEFHPAPDFLAALDERGIPFVAGSDAHSPEELRDRLPELEERFAELEVEPARPLG